MDNSVTHAVNGDPPPRATAFPFGIASFWRKPEIPVSQLALDGTESLDGGAVELGQFDGNLRPVALTNLTTHGTPGAEQVIEMTYGAGQVSHGTFKLSGASSFAAGPRLLGTGVLQGTGNALTAATCVAGANGPNRRQPDPTTGKASRPVANSARCRDGENDPFYRADAPGELPRRR